MEMTKLNKKSFYILMIICIAFIANIIVGAVVVFATLESQVANAMAIFEDANLENTIENLEQFVRIVAIITAILVLIIGSAYHGLMLWFVINHRRKPRRGIYLIVMLVFAILGMLFGIINLELMWPSFNIFNLVTGIIVLMLNVAVIAAVVTQRQHPDPAYDESSIPHYEPYEPFQE